MSSPADRSPARLVLQTAPGQEMVFGLEQDRTRTLGADASPMVVPKSNLAGTHVAPPRTGGAMIGQRRGGRPRVPACPR